MHRFCCPEAVWDGERVRIEGAAVVQMRRVLRLAAGDLVVLFGVDEWEYTVRLERVEREVAHGTILGRQAPGAEPWGRITLACALLKGEKAEWVLQKGTELGVSRFLLMQTRRTVATPDERRAAGRLDRYARIIREATEQCGRLYPPPVEGVYSLERVLTGFPADLRLILHGRAGERLGQVFRGSGVQGFKAGEVRDGEALSPAANSVLLLVGPEGGFAEEEVELAVEQGARPVSLGPRVLRAETAALAAVVLTMEALEG